MGGGQGDGSFWVAPRPGFNANIGRALGQVFERWVGRRWPRGTGGEELTVSARIVQVAQDKVVFYRLGGTEAAVAVAKERAGTIQDPAIARCFRRNAPTLLKRLEETRSVWEAVLEAEQGLPDRSSQRHNSRSPCAPSQIS